jgi:hypothetical protein
MAIQTQGGGFDELATSTSVGFGPRGETGAVGSGREQDWLLWLPWVLGIPERIMQLSRGAHATQCN